MALVFYINRDELLNALKRFAPFIKPQKMKSAEEDGNEDEFITYPEPYFEDKVTFLFKKEHLYLYILVDEVKYERVITDATFVEDTSFCLPLVELKDVVEYYNCKSLEFVEDRFSGFIVNDAVTKKHLFDIDASSVRLQYAPMTTFRDRPYSQAFPLERFMVLKALVSFAKYTCQDSIYKYKELIWFLIDKGYCNIFATNGPILRVERYPVNLKELHVFSIPGAYSVRIYNIISQWNYCPEYNIEYEDLGFCVNDSSQGGAYNESFEFPTHIEIMPNMQKVLNERTVNHRATMRVYDLRSTFNIIHAMQGKAEKVIMHFKHNHVNIYWKDTFEDKSVYEFKDVFDCDEEFVVALQIKAFQMLLSEIKTDNVFLYFIGVNKLDILSENEMLFGDTARIMATSLMDEKDQGLLEEGDKTLQNDSRYLEKYYPQSEEEQDEDDEDESSDDYQHASKEEMREEAVLRMKTISLYPEIIEYFEEEGDPQVYEPPYGAGYALEEEELEELHQTEAARGILIWGVIRHFTKFSGIDATIDHYLFVSDNKEEWGKERNDLYEGIPFVYTTMKEYPLKDYGHINIYMSPGGTPLRK